MITVRRYAEFRADFPDDHIWDEKEEDVVQTGGKAVAQAIADILVGLGCTIHDLDDNVGHCWECCFSYQGLALWFHVVNLNPCIFTLDEPHRATPNIARYYHVLLNLNEQLRRDGRFHDLTWYSYEDGRVGKEGFEIPITGDIPAPDVPPVEVVGKKLSFFDRLLAPLRPRPDVR
jgi:hypothetical protein